MNNAVYVCLPVTLRKQDFIAMKDLRNQCSLRATLLRKPVVGPRLEPRSLPTSSPQFPIFHTIVSLKTQEMKS